MTARDALTAIRERAEAATEGPWHRDRTNSLGAYVISVRNRAFTIVDGLLKRDAEFIAHARTDVPALVEVVEAVLALHQPFEAFIDQAEVLSCSHCLETGNVPSETPWDYRWPCPTVTAIETKWGDR